MSQLKIKHPFGQIAFVKHWPVMMEDVVQFENGQMSAEALWSPTHKPIAVILLRTRRQETLLSLPPLIK